MIGLGPQSLLLTTKSSAVYNVWIITSQEFQQFVVGFFWQALPQHTSVMSGRTRHQRPTKVAMLCKIFLETFKKHH